MDTTVTVIVKFDAESAKPIIDALNAFAGAAPKAVRTRTKNELPASPEPQQEAPKASETPAPASAAVEAPKTPAPEPVKVEQPKAPEGPTLQDLRKMAQDLLDAGQVDTLRAIVKDFKIAKISTAEPQQYAAIHERLKKATDALAAT